MRTPFESQIRTWGRDHVLHHAYCSERQVGWPLSCNSLFVFCPLTIEDGRIFDLRAVLEGEDASLDWEKGGGPTSILWSKVGHQQSQLSAHSHRIFTVDFLRFSFDKRRSLNLRSSSCTVCTDDEAFIITEIISTLEHEQKDRRWRHCLRLRKMWTTDVKLPPYY